MSRILVIQPYRMLQQAFALAMPEEYSVRFARRLGEAGALAQFDALVFDAFSLRECDALSAADFNLIEGLQMPILWIAQEGTGAPATRSGLIILKAPICREELVKSLGRCLEWAGDKTRRAATSRGKARQANSQKQPQTTPKDNVPPQIIDLVEVVDDGAAEDVAR